MNYEELKKIGEWLNSKGYGIDLTDDFWMEEYDLGEHKTRDICQMLFDYHTEQCNIANVVVSEAECEHPRDRLIMCGDMQTMFKCGKCGKDLNDH